MKLTGSQRQQIVNAILAGYDEPNLQRLVEFSLEQRLDQIVSGGNFTDQAAELVRWAERTGQVAVLVEALHTHNPTNPDIRQLGRDFEQWDHSPAPDLETAEGIAKKQTNRRLWPVIVLIALLGLLLIGGLWACNNLTPFGPGFTPTVVNGPPKDDPTAAPTDEPQPMATSSHAAGLPTGSPAPESTAPEPTATISTALESTVNIGFWDVSTESRIGVDETGQGELIGTETNDWIFEDGPAMIDVVLEMDPRSEALIIVNDSDGNIIYDHDAQFGPEERLINFEIPDREPYTIAARNVSNSRTDYTLTVTKSKPPQTIRLNETVSGQFYGAEGIRWIFQDGPATINVTLLLDRRGEALIVLYGNDGQTLEYANYQTGLEERFVNFEVPDDAPYTIMIRNEQNGPTDYTLTVEGG